MWTADAAIASVDRRVINFEADGSVLYTAQGLGTQACNVLMSLTRKYHAKAEATSSLRVRKQNSPAAPKNSTAFWREEFKTNVSIHLFSKPALRQTRSGCLRAS